MSRFILKSRSYNAPSQNAASSKNDLTTFRYFKPMYTQRDSSRPIVSVVVKWCALPKSERDDKKVPHQRLTRKRRDKSGFVVATLPFFTHLKVSAENLLF